MCWRRLVGAPDDSEGIAFETARLTVSTLEGVLGSALLAEQKKGRFRVFSGSRTELKTAAVEVDREFEVLAAAKACRHELHPLELGV